MTRQGCVPGIIDVAGDDPSAADYREAPTFYWTIALLDLGIGLPATIAGVSRCAGAGDGAGS